jgi:2-(1,2-epoxy-1,2-dihydrophenyl)acetyl-CoA isomerase
VNYQNIIAEKKDSIMLITLNRPDKLNAIDATMLDELARALQDADEDDEVKAVVLTGAGRAFSSGADVTTVAAVVKPSMSPVPAVELGRRVRLKPFAGFGDVALRLRNLDKPTIAAINGIAAGAGLSFALGCDIRIASEKAQFSLIFVRRGVVPDTGATYLLPRLVGTSKALELIFTGDMLDAVEAERIGLVNRVVPDESLMPVTKELATRIAEGPSVAIELMKRAVYQGLETNNFASQLAYEGWAQELCYETKDVEEGVRAFLEKRKPKFSGR